jgi:beta-glucosidase
MTLDDKITMVDGAGFSYGTAGYVGHIAAIPRLCEPGLNLEDGPQGVADGVPGVTQLPAPVALASSWNPSLARQYGGVVGSEERGKGADVNLGPTVNIVRDPRWGRAFETYGEDPYLSGQTAVGYIEGVQSKGVMAQVKHWAVYNQETNRNTAQDDALIGHRAMHEIYLPQFRAAVQQGKASSVMCSYAVINGQFACENDYILNVLKHQWAFPGFVTSDWGATHSTVPSAKAGLDMDMPGGQSFGPNYYGAPLKAAVQSGQVPMATINEMVSRILTEMFRFDLFASPPQGSLTAPVTSKAHAAVGRAVEESGTVLLKNSGHVLPLEPGRSGRVAVIGSDAGQAAMTSGGGSAGVVPPYTVTPIDGIRARAARSGVGVSYSQGDVPVTGALDAVPSSAFPGGLQVSYYNNTSQSGTPAATGTAPSVNLSWNGSPAPGVNATGWSAKISGQISLPDAGRYDLSLTLTGQATVLVNGNKVISGSGAFTGGASTSRATVTLPRGTTSIEVDYAAPSSGTASLTLGWATPSMRSQLLTEAATAAGQAGVAVVFASLFETEGADLPNIGLPASENDLIAAVAKANPNTVVVLNTGSAVTMPWLPEVRGVIEAWYPGQDDGHEIAAVLFGDVNPSGKLPVSFPRRLSEVPASTQQQWPGVHGDVHYSEGLLVGYRWYTTRGIQPMFAFGYGLSYTTFAFRGLQLYHHGNGRVSVCAEVTNTGSRTGTDVVQLYVHDPASTGEPAEQLKAYQQVTLRPHQTRRVELNLARDAFSWWNPSSASWTLTPGTYRVMVGDSSDHLPLTAALTLGTEHGSGHQR